MIGQNNIIIYTVYIYILTEKHQLPNEGCNLAMLSEAQHLYNMK